MGIMANLAAKTEIKNRDQILALTRADNPRSDVRPLVQICHIIVEDHNGIFIVTSNGGFGIYRCQGWWWIRAIPPQLYQDLIRGAPYAPLQLRSIEPQPLISYSVGISGMAGLLSSL